MKSMYRVLGIAIGLVVALCGCERPPGRDHIKEAVRDTFEAGKFAGRLEVMIEQAQEKLQAVKTAHEQYESYVAENVGHLLPPPTKDSPKWVDVITPTAATIEGATADTPETMFIVGPDVTQDETWTINTDADSRSVISLKGPSTLTFYFGDKQCGQLKCDGQTISFTGDVDKSAQEFVDIVNKIFEWQRTDGE